MDHKAFVFDTNKFHAEIEPVMKDSITNAEVAHQYICDHLDEFQSPYTGDTLEEGWEEAGRRNLVTLLFKSISTYCLPPVTMWRTIGAWGKCGMP